MLQAARRRLRDLPNADVRRGELASLPIADGELDAAMMMLVLHHVPDPADVLREAARTVRPKGRFVLCDMLPHDREEYKQQMGHVWLGFADDQLRRLLGGAGFEDVRIVPLPVDSSAKGPALFVASAAKRT
jgi:ubiquinone/menaquinone biosynthesis C-methylase UbiE